MAINPALAAKLNRSVLGGLQQMPIQQPGNPYGERLDQLGGALGLAQMQAQQQPSSLISAKANVGVLGELDPSSYAQGSVLDRAVAQGMQPQSPYVAPQYSVLDPSQYKAYDPTLDPWKHKKNAGGWTWKEYGKGDAILNSSLGKMFNLPQGYTPQQQKGYLDMINSPVYQDLLALNAGGKNPGTSASKANMMMASRLHDVGIDDLEDIGYTNVNGKTVFYDRATGRAIPTKLKGTNSGEGMQEIQLTVDSNGRVVPRNVWEDTSDNDVIAPVLMAASIAAPYLATGLLPGIGGALGASGAWAPVIGGAVYGAGTGALQSGLAGGNVLKGALTGGLTGGIGGAIGGGLKLPSGEVIPQFFSTGSKLADAALKGGLSGAISSGIYGGNALKGGALGALAAAGGSLGGNLLSGANIGDVDVGRLLGGMAGSQLAGNLGSKLIGSPYDQNMQKAVGNAQAMAAQQAAAARRQFDISGLSADRQARVQHGVDTAYGYANPGKARDYDWKVA